MKIKVFDNHPVEKNLVCIGFKIPLTFSKHEGELSYGLFWNPNLKGWQNHAIDCWFNREDLTDVMNDMNSYW